MSIVCMTFTLTASCLSVIIQGCTCNDKMKRLCILNLLVSLKVFRYHSHLFPLSEQGPLWKPIRLYLKMKSEWRNSTSALNQVLTTSGLSDISVCWLAVGMRFLSFSLSLFLFLLGSGYMFFKNLLYLYDTQIKWQIK